jgi:peptidoglycan hydrolase CwlO-like protein
MTKKAIKEMKEKLNKDMESLKRRIKQKPWKQNSLSQTKSQQKNFRIEWHY